MKSLIAKELRLHRTRYFAISAQQYLQVDLIDNHEVAERVWHPPLSTEDEISLTLWVSTTSQVSMTYKHQKSCMVHDQERRPLPTEIVFQDRTNAINTAHAS